jgi:hypothetical protein
VKKLLSFILEKSENNQFLITTHSNIVLKYLASDELTKVFKVDMDFNDMKIPTSSINEVANSFEARREILEDLGYELTDFDISVAWLILEESSAETIIKDFLIPHFASSLKGKLRTCSANGISKISARFEAIHSLCLFLHLEKVFNDKIWVLIDKGENEAKIIQDLKNSYKSWNQDRFYQLSKHDFEEYYPPKYKQKVSDILQISNSQEKRTKKKELLQEVEKWYRDEPETAKADFMTSASEVINLLKTIEASVT